MTTRLDVVEEWSAPHRPASIRLVSLAA